MHRSTSVLAVCVLAFGAGCDKSAGSKVDPAKGAETMSISITSSAFAQGAAIPSNFTCEGADVSVPLTWSGAPSGTKSFALIVDDADAPDPKAPTMTYVHWVLYDIPASVSSLDEGAS